MPKTNDATGATYAGHQGVVQHGAPLEGGQGRVFSELDPERNLDGTPIEGEHPDRDEDENVQERYVSGVSEVEPIQPLERESGEEQATDEKDAPAPVDEPREEEQTSAGISSPKSTPKTASTRGKTASNP